jgi:hypothetical protein
LALPSQAISSAVLSGVDAAISPDDRGSVVTFDFTPSSIQVSGYWVSGRRYSRTCISGQVIDQRMTQPASWLITCSHVEYALSRDIHRDQARSRVVGDHGRQRSCRSYTWSRRYRICFSVRKSAFLFFLFFFLDWRSFIISLSAGHMLAIKLGALSLFLYRNFSAF